MKTRFGRLLLLLLGLAVCLVLLTVLLNREPQYQGKRLSAWFKQYYRTGPNSNQSNEDQHNDAALALRAMGTNAVPFLLNEFYSYRPDSPLRTNVLTFLNKLPRPLRFPPFVPAGVICNEAANAIGEIKPPEEFLLSLVTNRLYSTRKLEPDATIDLLCTVGAGASEVMPFLRDMLRSTNAMDQLVAVVRLRQLGPSARPALPDLGELVNGEKSDQRAVHAACRVLAEFDAEAADAVPAIKARLEKEKQATSRINFAKTLCRIDAQQTAALEVLIQYAQDQTNSQRGFAITSLGIVGLNAKAAIPVLLEAAREEDERVWNIAANALVRIGETNLALSLVAERLKHEAKQIRLNAAMFIVNYEPAHALAVSSLVELARDPSWGRIAIQQLVRLRPVPESAVSVLREIAATEHHQFRVDAERALRSVQSAGAGQRETR